MTTDYQCEQAPCSAQFTSFHGLIYHTASVHANFKLTNIKKGAAKCPVCNDTFLLINGNFCYDHYMLVHQVSENVTYTTWLHNASIVSAVPQSEGEQMPAEKDDEIQVKKKRKHLSKKVPETDVDVEELRDEEDDLSESDLRQSNLAKEIVKEVTIHGGPGGPGIYLNLSYDLAEEYLKLGLSYNVVDKLTKDLLKTTDSSGSDME